MSDSERQEAIGSRDPALEAIDAQPDTEPVVDPLARYRVHLNRVAIGYVADYPLDKMLKGDGLTDKQERTVTEAAQLILRAFAFDVVEGNISLEPPQNGHVEVQRLHNAPATEQPTIPDQSTKPASSGVQKISDNFILGEE